MSPYDLLLDGTVIEIQQLVEARQGKTADASSQSTEPPPTRRSSHIGGHEITTAFTACVSEAVSKDLEYIHSLLAKQSHNMTYHP